MEECEGSESERKSCTVLLGNLNARVGDELVESVMSGCGVHRVNESDERLIGLCLERELEG